MTRPDHGLSHFAAATALLLLLPAPVRAQDDDRPVSHFAEAGIEIDGDQLDDPHEAGEDWFPFYPPFVDPIRQEDDTLCGTPPAPKNDLTNTFFANDLEYLYVGMERLATTGNTSFFFSFDLTGDGPSPGDFIFVFCFGSRERVTDTYVLEFDEATGSFVRDSTPPHVDFAVNSERILAPFGALDRHGRPSPTLEPGQFAEARISLAEIEGFELCAADAVQLEIQTKSSCSLPSECKDTSGPLRVSFLPVSVDLVLSQPEGCEAVVVASAGASSPRSGASLSYTWFLNGEDVTDRDPSWSTSDTIEIGLDEECGPTEVAVIVEDGSCVGEDSALLDVNRRPVAEIAHAVVDPCDGTLSFSAAGSADCNGEELTYAWDFDGDGLVDSTEESGTWVYDSCGERLVTLWVSDGECDSEPATRSVYVNEPPVAGLALTASDAHCLEVAWEVTSIDCDELEDSALHDEVLSTSVDFGDGSPPVEGLSGVHRYAGCGTWLVTTTTTDASGCTDILVRELSLGVIAEVE